MARVSSRTTTKGKTLYNIKQLSKHNGNKID